MQVSNTELTKLINELTKIEIDFKVLEESDSQRNSIYCIFTYNGFSDSLIYEEYLLVLLEEVKNEIIENHFILLNDEDKFNYRDYLNLKINQFYGTYRYIHEEIKTITAPNNFAKEFKIQIEYLQEMFADNTQRFKKLSINLPDIDLIIENSLFEQEFNLTNCHLFKEVILDELQRFLVDSNIITKEIMDQISEWRNEDNLKAKSIKGVNSNLNKLIWKGTPSQFGYIIHELISNGFLEKPNKHFTKDVELYLQLFEINTTKKNLENEINIFKNSLVAKNKAKFIIPNLNQLD